MAVRIILQYPNAILDTPGQLVDLDVLGFAEVIRDLFDTMDKGVERERYVLGKDKYRSMVGLSANQIGLPWQIAVVSHAGIRFAMVNSQVLKVNQEVKGFDEGCMSLPESTLVPIWRPTKIRISNTWWWNKAENKYDVKDVKLVDFEARIALHEFDHLQGMGIRERGEFNAKHKNNQYLYERGLHG